MKFRTSDGIAMYHSGFVCLYCLWMLDGFVWTASLKDCGMAVANTAVIDGYMGAAFMDDANIAISECREEIFSGGTVDAHFGTLVGIAASDPSPLRSIALTSFPIISFIDWSALAAAKEQPAATTPARRTLECMLVGVCFGELGKLKDEFA